MANDLSIPAIEWLRTLAAETRAFQLKKVEAEVRQEAAGAHVIRWDYVVQVLIPGSKTVVRFYVDTKRELSPQGALGALERMTLVPPAGLPLLCSPRISARVAELCREQGVSYLDAAGNCWITGPGLVIRVQGRPNETEPSRPLLDLFAPKSSRVLRVLLSQPKRGWQVQALAQEAGVSLGLASKVKSALVREAFAREQDRLVRVRDPLKLLREWAGKYDPPGRAVSLFSLARPAEAEQKIVQWCETNSIPCALTQLAGAWRVAPMVRYDRSTLYVLRRPTDLWSVDALIAGAEARRVETGASLIVRLTEDTSVFYGRRPVGAVSVVSPLQLFLDLTQLAGRGAEAANEVLEREILPQFPAPRHTVP